MATIRSDLPALGEFSYNGITFSSAARIELFKATPEFSADGRTVIWHVFEVAVKDWLTGSHETTIQSMSQSLGHAGGKLVLSGKGIGTYSINVGSVRDVAWGPKPGPFTYRIIGSSLTTEITWSVKFAIPNCSLAVYSMAFAEVMWAAGYRIDKHGLTTRTISGHVRIPMTRKSVGDRTIPDCVDAYREEINPARIQGFRRVPGNYQVNHDRTMLTFEITDEEFPTYTSPPAGCLDWQASHTLSTSTAILTTYNANLEASYVVGKGLDKRLALAHFWKFAIDRLSNLKGLMTKPDKNGRTMPLTAIPTGFSVTEDVTGTQTARFTLSYLVAGLQFKDLLKGSGLWTDPIDTTWQRWDQTIGDAYLGPRGLAQLELAAKDDLIVDLCRDLDPILVSDTPARTRQVPITPDLVAVFPELTPGSSWLHWRCAIEVEKDPGTVELRSLPLSSLRFDRPASADQGVQDGAGIPGFTSNGVSGANVGKIINDAVDEAKQALSIQRRTAPLVYFSLVGSALRAKWPVPVPRLAKINGFEPRDVSRPDRNERFTLKQVAHLGQPIWQAAWRLRFVIEKIPKEGLDKLLPVNPLLEYRSGF